MSKTFRVLLIDGTWYLHRAYHVARAMKVPAVRMRKSLPGHVLSMVLKDIEFLNATHVAITFDAPDGFRYKIYPEYKANRLKVDVNPNDHEVDENKRMRKDEIYSFLKKVKKVLKYAGFCVVTVDEMEADDLLAAGASKLSKKAIIFIATRDKDLMTMVNDEDRVKLYWPATGKTPALFIDEKEVTKIKGVPPRKMFELLCLAGDKVDNIPGVVRKTKKGTYKNLGLAGAAKLLKQFGSIKKAMKDKTAPEGKMLRSNKSRLHISMKLVRLNTECWNPRLKDLEFKKVDEQGLVNSIGYLPKNIYSIRQDASISKMRGLFR